MKIVIVGGVAAGASAAARMRRLDENAEIVLLERGPYISYANCGLPYHIGGVIPERDSLLVMTPERLRARFHIDVRTSAEVTGIDRAAKTVTVREKDKEEYQLAYDKLLLATGSSPVEPALPGADDPRVVRLWTIPDMDGILGLIGRGAKKALVIGGGFIGLETAENLRLRKLEVTIVELAPQVLPTVDREMSAPVSAELARQGIALELGHKVTEFRKRGQTLAAVLEDGRELEADLVVMSIGVTPNTGLARTAGLELGARGHIVVDEHLRTSDPDIYAAGDAIEFTDPLAGGKNAIALAGPANRQGRIAADHMAGRNSRFSGSFGTAILKAGTLSAGSVGFTERRLLQQKTEFHKIYLHAPSNASYYPGGGMIHLKLLFAPGGAILGAQLVGAAGVDKRLDVIATAMKLGATARQLAELELGYAPPYGSAKDPVNLAGMIAGNVLDGTSRIVHADALPEGALLLDVREDAEFEAGSIPGAIHIPLGELRNRLGELDSQRPLVTYCRVGMRGYLAERLLRQHGFDVSNLSGGYLSWQLFHAGAPKPAVRTPPAPETVPAPAARLDVRALACPGPVVNLKRKVDAMAPGEAVTLLAPLSFASDLHGWIASSGNTLLSCDEKPEYLEAVVRKAGAAQTPATPANAGETAAIVLFSNSLDKAMAAMIIACGMAAAGKKVGIFFTFWGLSVLRKNPPPPVSKSFLAGMFGWMLPKGAQKLALSQMNMAGAGGAMLKHIMAQQNVTPLPELIEQARALGVRFVACEMAMGVMGITREELIEVDDVAGVASFVAMAKNGGSTLFI